MLSNVPKPPESSVSDNICDGFRDEDVLIILSHVAVSFVITSFVLQVNFY